MTKYLCFQNTVYSVTNTAVTFQHAPAHMARATVRETPDFIASAVWPVNRPDLNPVDYQVWEKLQERMHHSRIVHDVDQLKSRLINKWKHFDHGFFDEAVS